MANDKKMVEEITSMEEDFAKWYTDIVKKADLIDYSSVKGCMIIRPYGYAIWENIQKILDTRFKETDTAYAGKVVYSTRGDMKETVPLTGIELKTGSDTGRYVQAGNYVRVYAVPETLTYLHKGGRLSKTAFNVATPSANLPNLSPFANISP